MNFIEFKALIEPIPAHSCSKKWQKLNQYTNRTQKINEFHIIDLISQKDETKAFH